METIAGKEFNGGIENAGFGIGVRHGLPMGSRLYVRFKHLFESFVNWLYIFLQRVVFLCTGSAHDLKLMPKKRAENHYKIYYRCKSN